MHAPCARGVVCARGRRGSTATYAVVTLPIIGMFAAFGLELAYLRVVHQELQGVADAASHAAMLEIDGTQSGLDAARASAIEVASGIPVDLRPYELTADQIEFGDYDPETGVFTPTDDPSKVNSVRVPLVEEDVGLGLGQAFFGQEFSVSACSASMAGDGNANTGVEGGPGLANGHFDYDSTDAGRAASPYYHCPGGTECKQTTKHTHEYDDKFDTVFVDFVDELDGHLPIDGCAKSTKAFSSTVDASCTAGGTRTLPDTTPFKIVVANADLSPGGMLWVNGQMYDVEDYDDIAFGDLPTWQLGPGANQLTSLRMAFDVDTIANCELIPTNTGDVRANTKGIYGEWRSGALTVQLVRTNATFTGGLSAGGHDVVRTRNDGLYFEGTFFWHWDGPSYIAAESEDWQEQYDQLDCGDPVYIDQLHGGSACQ